MRCFMKTLTSAIALLATLPLGAVQETGKDSQDLKAGLYAQYFNLAKEFKKFPDLVIGQKPQLTRVDSQINFVEPEGWGYGNLPWREYFAVIWTGLLRAPVDGKYTLYLNSDDGSRL